MNKHQGKLRESMNQRRLKKKVSPGAPAGMIQIDPGASRTVVNIHSFDRETLKEKKDITPSEAAGFRGLSEVLWVRVEGLGDERLLTQLRDSFGLHRLAMEDVVNVGQRPKVERYGDVLFVVLTSNTSTEHCQVEQISLFLGPDFVMTVTEHPSGIFAPILKRIEERIGLIREQRSCFLAYAIMDCVVDFYYPLLASLGDHLSAIEEDILADRKRDVIHSVHRVKQDLNALHRTLFAIREAVSQLPLAGNGLIDDLTKPYLRDLHDHTQQLLDLTDNQRMLTSDLLEIEFAFSSKRLNEIMKLLTIIGAIFLPLSFIAAVYGMNFDTESSPWNMPELRWVYGYPFALMLMATTAVLLLSYFWRKGWLR